MYLKNLLIVSFLFLSETFAIKIGLGEDPNLLEDLKTCLSTLIEKVCPDCTSGYLVSPKQPSWEAQAFANFFSGALPMYGMMMYTMDHVGHETSLVGQFGFYLVNSHADLKKTLELLVGPQSKTKYVVWLNFHLNHNLRTYLRKTTPAIWNGGSVQDITFISWIRNNDQVVGTSVEISKNFCSSRLGELDVYSTREVNKSSRSQSLPKLTELQKPVLTVAVQPALPPFIKRKTNDPGGYIGELMNVLKGRLHFTPKYVWDVRIRDFENFTTGDGLRIAFKLQAGSQKGSPVASPIVMSEAVWMIARPNLVDARNVLTLPFKNGIFLHVILLAIYTSAMLYFGQDIDKSRIMLRLFGMFFGVGVGWFPKKALYRFMVVLWCFTSYVLVQAYLAALTSELSSPIINTPFRDVDDLIESGIDIFCSRPLKELYCNLESNSSTYICEKCLSFESDQFQYLLQDSLSMNKSWRPFAAALETQVMKSSFGWMSFTFMTERIGTWPTMVYAKTDMKFLPGIIELSERLFEAGILKEWLSRYEINNATNYEFARDMLNMSHISDVFIILYVGWSCSIVVFTIEIFMKWWSSN